MISIVIPALNEVENLSFLIPEIYSVLRDWRKEVIIVNGHSVDNTGEAVRTLAREYSGLSLIEQSGKGFANALLEGIAAARGGIIVTMDAENHLPGEIPLLVKTLINSNADVIIGSRFLKDSKVDLQRKRFISTRLGNRIAKAALKLNVKDCSSGFRAYRSSTVKEILANIETEYFSVQVELLERIKERGGLIAEVPAHYVSRTKGESKFKFKLAIKDATKLLKIAKEDRLKKIKSRSSEIKSKIADIEDNLMLKLKKNKKK